LRNLEKKHQLSQFGLIVRRKKAFFKELWASLNNNKKENAENPLKSRQQFKIKFK
jgi:hypothetical protein